MEGILITALIVARNEEDYIKKSLKSLLEQDFPKNMYEIIIIDGCSTDNTLNIVKELMLKYEDKIKITLLRNEKKILAAGWNIGIKHASGKYVVRIDAHATAERDFLKKNLETIQKLPDNVAAVGGRLTSVYLENQDKTVSKVLSSPFGIGNSKFRYANKSQYVDTVAYGLYKKEVFDKVGYFNENLSRSEDNDMHGRIKKVGYKFYFNPEIKSKYYVRSTLKKMLRQAFFNGKWNIIVFKEDRKSLSLRHLVPLLFVLSILFLGTLSCFIHQFIYVLIFEVVLYIILGLIFAIRKTRNIIEIAKMIVYFFLLHMSYGVGSLISIFAKKI